MSTDRPAPKRPVTPRRWALAGTVLGLAAGGVAPAPLTQLVLAPALAAEAGESGEAGIVRAEGPAEYLTELGLFEAAHRITAALYGMGEVALAQEHLEASHHAYYEDIAPHVAAHGAPDFEAAAARFAEAVMAGAAPDVVASTEAQVLAAIATAYAAAMASPHDQLLSMKDLVAVAAADYEGGVEAGKVSFAQEYRDAWGFVEVARARAEAMAASPEAAQSKAGRAVLEQLDGLGALFPALVVDAAGGDPTLLPAAAAWIEIIALRVK